MTPGRRVGVFGGAFDPPHLAHLALAAAAIEQAHLDELLIVPTGQAWHKPRALSPAADRLAMAQLAFGSQAKVTVDARELLRDGASYTVDTLEALCADISGADFCLFIGADQAGAFATWHRWRRIIELATVFVAERGGTICRNGSLDAIAALRDVVTNEGLDAKRVQPLMLPPLAISATDIRQRAMKGLGISHLVPEAVAGYIAQHHLYQTAR